MKRRVPLAVGMAATLAACAHIAPRTSPTFVLSSDSSSYSPTAHLRVRATRLGATLRLHVDSAVVAIPGDVVPGTPPLMSALYLTALLVEADSGALHDTGVRAASANGTFGERRAWRSLATSDSVRIVDQLRFGERVGVPPVVLSLAVPPRLGARTWVIFRISGNTVQISAPLTPGEQPRQREFPGGVRVYVCGDQDLLGRSHGDRAAALRRAYGLIC